MANLLFAPVVTRKAISFAKGNHYDFEISVFEPSYLEITCKDDLAHHSNYLEKFTIWDNDLALNIRYIAERFEDLDTDIFDWLPYLNNEDKERLVVAYTNNKDRDWDKLDALLLNNETLPQYCNNLLEYEYRLSHDSMLGWTSAEDGYGFTFLASDSNWHSYCGAWFILKSAEGYDVPFSDDGNDYLCSTSLVGAKWLAEAYSRDHLPYEKGTVEHEHRVGKGSSGQWYAISRIDTNGVGVVIVRTYLTEGDFFGETLKTVTYEDYNEGREIQEKLTLEYARK